MDDSQSEIHGGGCSCGAVRFTVRGALRAVVYCHCDQCRRQSGHFLGATSVPDGILAVEGAQHLTWYDSSDVARRGFCSICGSGLFWKHNRLPKTSVLAGSFDNPSGLKASHHIFTGQKGDYYAIDDGLPQQEGWER
jgi:hypothetical protein